MKLFIFLKVQRYLVFLTENNSNAWTKGIVR